MKNYLNVGCGSKFHEEWVNIDMISHNPYVIQHNLLKDFPFCNDKFDVVYHSQVLEHFPKEKALSFINECFRVIKPGGIIRVVVPDLENIVNEYKKYLDLCLTQKDVSLRANYDWIMLEMYDQTVRNYSGGQMAKYLSQPILYNEKYIIGRIGFVGRAIRKQLVETKKMGPTLQDKNSTWKGLVTFTKKIKLWVKPHNYRTILLDKILSNDEKELLEIGKFRLGGEIHYWMYDRFSLEELLKKSGFEKIKIMNPFNSEIPNWLDYELDVKDNLAFDPTSLFMEARKPITR